MAQGRDFLLEDNNSPSMNSSSGRDFLLEDQPSKENLATSAALAIPRIGTDLVKRAYQDLQSIPGYYQAAKTEVPGAFNAMTQHPIHAINQGLAGLTELGHGLLNAPHGMAEYAANRLNLLPQNFPEKVPFQKDISQDINQVFDKPRYPGEELIRGIGRNALNISGAKGLASTLNPLNLTSGGIAKNVLNKAFQVQKKYSNSYGKLFNEAEQKGYENLNHVPHQIDLGTLEKYTPANRLESLKDFASDPNHETAHFAKSELLGLQRQLKKQTTLTGGQKKQLNAVNDAIGTIKNNMFKDTEGNVDKGMMDKYEKIQKGFKNEALPYRINAIKKYQAGEITSGQLRNALSKGVFRAKRGFHHPAIAIRNSLFPALGIGAGIGGGILGIPPLYRYLTGNQEQNR